MEIYVNEKNSSQDKKFENVLTVHSCQFLTTIILKGGFIRSLTFYSKDLISTHAWDLSDYVEGTPNA